jgi:putative membrane protein insertion efficiency factor
MSSQITIKFLNLLLKFDKKHIINIDSSFIIIIIFATKMWNFSSKTPSYYLILIIKALISLYKRFISPFMKSQCIFVPTCSSYALSALNKHGLWRGIKLTFRRLMRCHPFGDKSDYCDPVP